MKKEQISFLSHSISPFFCLIWFLSSHLSFPPLFIYTLQSLPIAFLIFSFIFPFFLCPVPSTVILSHRFSTCSSFMYFLVPFYLHSLSSPYHTSVLLFFLPDFSLFISFTFLSSFFIYSILSFLHSLSHIHPPLLFSLFYTSPEDMMNAEVIER